MLKGIKRNLKIANATLPVIAQLPLVKMTVAESRTLTILAIEKDKTEASAGEESFITALERDPWPHTPYERNKKAYPRSHK